MSSKRPAVTWKTFGFALTHLTTSNSFGLPRINITPLLLLRNASTPPLASSSSNPRKLWNSSPQNTLFECKPILSFPSLASSQSLSQMFATSHKISDKILKLHTALKSSSTVSSPHIPPKNTPTILSSFTLVSENEVSKVISQSSSSLSDLDPMPTSRLKQCLSGLLPTLTNIKHPSLASGTFTDHFKSCSVITLLKKYNLDKEDLSNYRPISHLSFLSKLTERVVKNRSTSHLSTNNLLNSYQSAHTKHHST